MTEPNEPDDKIAYLVGAISDLDRQLRDGLEALQAAETSTERKVALLRIMNPANSLRGASYSLLRVAEREMRRSGE